jgi:Mg/Co/Ni transporter MgtE
MRITLEKKIRLAQVGEACATVTFGVTVAVLFHCLGFHPALVGTPLIASYLTARRRWKW